MLIRRSTPSASRTASSRRERSTSSEMGRRNRRGPGGGARWTLGPGRGLAAAQRQERPDAERTGGDQAAEHERERRLHAHRVGGTRWARLTVCVGDMRRRTAIFFITILLSLAIGLAMPSSARADLALLFTSPRAHWGQRVHVRSPGRYAPFSGVRAYFVPMALARSARAQRPTGPPRSR